MIDTAKLTINTFPSAKGTRLGNTHAISIVPKNVTIAVKPITVISFFILLGI